MNEAAELHRAEATAMRSWDIAQLEAEDVHKLLIGSIVPRPTDDDR
jgi:hypothetical protein